ncbi:hypothetical protein C8J27_1091, partial [Rhodobacter aestuarii]
CASVKRLFRIRLLLQVGQTLHQIEGTSGGQVTPVYRLSEKLLMLQWRTWQ